MRAGRFKNNQDLTSGNHRTSRQRHNSAYLCRPGYTSRPASRINGSKRLNRIIWIVGLVVIVLFILGFFGLR